MGRVYLVVLLALAGMLVLAGCSGDDGEEGSRGIPPRDYYDPLVDIGVRGSELGRLLVAMEPGDSAGASYVKELGQLRQKAEDLKPPSAFKKDHEAFVEGLGRLAEAGEQAENSSQAGDAAGLASARKAINVSLSSILDTMLAIRGSRSESPTPAS